MMELEGYVCSSQNKNQVSNVLVIYTLTKIYSFDLRMNVIDSFK